MVDRSKIPSVVYGGTTDDTVPSPTTEYPTASYYWRGDRKWAYLQISALNDIDLTNLQNRNVLIYNGTKQQWENVASNSLVLHNDLTDLQGGLSSEYYHLSENQYLLLTGSTDALVLHHHNSKYYNQYEFLTTSLGVASAGSPIKLDASGQIDISMIPGLLTDELVAIDAAATAGYIGATSNDGVLRVDSTISYVDGGDYVTLSVSEANIDHNSLNNLAVGDVHTQYLSAAGTRDLTGDWTITANSIYLTAGRIGFRDANIYIESTNDGYLDLYADTGIDLNANTTVSGTLDATGNLSAIDRITAQRATGEYLQLDANDGGLRAVISDGSIYIKPSNTLVGWFSSTSFGFYSDKYLSFGQSSTAHSRFEFDTGQTVDALIMGLSDYAAGNDGRYMLVCDVSDMDYDFEHSDQTNPTIFIHSANQSTDQWISFSHDATNGIIDVGTGNIKLNDDVLLMGSNGIYFNDTNTQISEDGSGNLTFKDENAGTITLSALASVDFIPLWNLIY
ncbi:MAG: hypothetical protein WDA06_05840 [Phenylobacterium sp.]